MKKLPDGASVCSGCLVVKKASTCPMSPMLQLSSSRSKAWTVLHAFPKLIETKVKVTKLLPPMNGPVDKVSIVIED